MGLVVVQLGDVIVVFYDILVLYMFRFMVVSNYMGDDGVLKQIYEYLGEVYCYGMMYGEILEIEIVEDFFLVEYCVLFIFVFINYFILFIFGFNILEVNY